MSDHATESPPSRLLQAWLIPAVVLSLLLGVVPTFRKIADLVGEIQDTDFEQRRVNHSLWYSRQRSCLEEAGRLIPEDADVVLQTESSPPWLAPYYLAPRRFYYDRSEIRRTLEEVQGRYWEMRMVWHEAGPECRIRHLPASDAGEGIR